MPICTLRRGAGAVRVGGRPERFGAAYHLSHVMPRRERGVQGPRRPRTTAHGPQGKGRGPGGRRTAPTGSGTGDGGRGTEGRAEARKDLYLGLTVSELEVRGLGGFTLRRTKLELSGLGVRGFFGIERGPGS